MMIILRTLYLSYQLIFQMRPRTISVPQKGENLACACRGAPMYGPGETPGHSAGMRADMIKQADIGKRAYRWAESVCTGRTGMRGCPSNRQVGAGLVKVESPYVYPPSVSGKLVRETS